LTEIEFSSPNQVEPGRSTSAKMLLKLHLPQ
jgi:hypothetical protein